MRTERGEILHMKAYVIMSTLKKNIADRTLAAIEKERKTNPSLSALPFTFEILRDDTAADVGMAVVLVGIHSIQLLT